MAGDSSALASMSKRGGDQKMRAHIRRRMVNSWTIAVTLERSICPSTGRSKPRQKWITVRGTKDNAQARLSEFLSLERAVEWRALRS